ncbi:cell wall proline rich protein [Aspergillus luchuensis]|uniref:Cell wall proline rich protein n=1 Tax=Aspergillus kawachii TaxID=1069201 RepID=A0A146F8B6_ASPKA|nr:cell wall proline rich protein [Aspergillus luchuensis]
MLGFKLIVAWLGIGIVVSIVPELSDSRLTCLDVRDNQWKPHSAFETQGLNGAFSRKHPSTVWTGGGLESQIPWYDVGCTDGAGVGCTVVTGDQYDLFGGPRH